MSRIADPASKPKAEEALVLAAKARAVLFGRYYVSTEDIRAVARAQRELVKIARVLTPLGR